ncbi:hypothetical protein OnM2_014010 [Erysiphe neolycopersici]|uniref:Uncharacterized protein n=1 Tax=Erysiphe neolycopersici TaxID=212602 RepID=A0A420I5L4_9PEZI|nr:hypothetical protein OnM2_014010 [Erysiphe neolycopersici]
MLRPWQIRISTFGQWSHNVYRRNASTRSQVRIERIVNRLPKYMRPYVRDLKSAPFTHILSFLILHELTAILPLVGFTAGFYYSGWSPQTWVKSMWVDDGVEKFGRYFSKKRWFGFGQTEGEMMDKTKNPELGQNDVGIVEESDITKNALGMMINSEMFLIQVATAYVITKILLPVRVAASIWFTPWFAKKVLGSFIRFYTRS